MPQTQMVRSRTPSSSTSSRMARMASGSPQPGHSECSVESNRSDFAETFLSGGGAVTPPPARGVAGVSRVVATDECGDLEHRARAESRVVVADAAYRQHRRAP